MAQITAADDGSEVRFNHGLAVEEGRPDIGTTASAVRTALRHASNDDEFERFDALFRRLVDRRDYTEGHHPVRVSLSDDERNTLILAHWIAADRVPSLADKFSANEELLLD